MLFRIDIDQRRVHRVARDAGEQTLFGLHPYAPTTRCDRPHRACVDAEGRVCRCAYGDRGIAVRRADVLSEELISARVTPIAALPLRDRPRNLLSAQS
jgi:hypothetical protein